MPRPWGIQWPVQCQWGWSGSPGAGFPKNQTGLTGNDPHRLINIGRETRVQNKITQPYTLTAQNPYQTVFGYERKTWLSDSPWSRSNWTLDTLAWKEHIMSVNKRHDKQEQEKWDTQKLSGKISLPVSLINCCLNQTVVLFGFWYLHGSCFPCRNVKQFYQYCKQKNEKMKLFLKKGSQFQGSHYSFYNVTR